MFLRFKIIKKNPKGFKLSLLYYSLILFYKIKIIKSYILLLKSCVNFTSWSKLEVYEGVLVLSNVPIRMYQTFLSCIWEFFSLASKSFSFLLSSTLLTRCFPTAVFFMSEAIKEEEINFRFEEKLQERELFELEVAVQKPTLLAK